MNATAETTTNWAEQIGAEVEVTLPQGLTKVTHRTGTIARVTKTLIVVHFEGHEPLKFKRFGVLASDAHRDQYGTYANGRKAMMSQIAADEEAPKYVPTAEEIAECVADMKAEILADIADGTQPADVADFSTLHDYVDANCYGGMCDDDNPRSAWDVDALIRIQEDVHQWLVAGRPAEEERVFIPNEAPAEEFPTAARLVAYMQMLAKEDLAEGEEPALDELVEMADQLFPNFPDDADALGPFHAKCMAILKEAEATMKTWLAEQHMPCNGAGLECTVEAHDHFTDDDEDAHTPEGARLCNDCGAPTHWDETTQDYWHDAADAPECFLIHDQN